MDAIGAPSRFRLIRKAVALARIFPTLDLSIEEKAVWLKLKKIGQFPDEDVCKNKSLINLLCNLPDVLAIAGITDTALGGLLL